MDAYNLNVRRRQGEDEVWKPPPKEKSPSPVQILPEEAQNKYAVWSAGVKQLELREKEIEEIKNLESKSLARHKDDEQYNEYMKSKEFLIDPILGMKNKKKKDKKKREFETLFDSDDEQNKSEFVVPTEPQPKRTRLVYKGPQPPQNRYNIPPGYRWDGVVRSNGYEAKLVAEMARKERFSTEAYKWSVEDM